MPEDDTNSWSLRVSLIIFLISCTGVVFVAGDSLITDRQVLLDLKTYLDAGNVVNRGIYSTWNYNSSNPCDWQGISCNLNRTRVVGIILSGNSISGEIFKGFSGLSELTHLDLSTNTMNGSIPSELNNCQNLKYLNLSHNLIEGGFTLSGLKSLEVLDVSVNRISGEILNFSGVCDKLKAANLSGNHFSGWIDNAFDECFNLEHLDLSANCFSGVIWPKFTRLKWFSISENFVGGQVDQSLFTGNCNLVGLDLSGNNFTGTFPGEISDCQKLKILCLWGNHFTGKIPTGIGSISSMEGLFLGNNSFDSEIPSSLLNCTNLQFLDLSRNNFGGLIQPILGKFTQVKFLVLHSNSYVGGLQSSGILRLPNIVRLDLSYNNFSGFLPVDITQMKSLKYLILAYNNFSGSILTEFGNLAGLQALDLSFNRLNGSIPSSFGNLKSLLWLMLANNQLSGEIPPEIGNCSSLLWLNLANNQFSGKIPSELTNIGRNPDPTFQANRLTSESIYAGSGECLAMKRWIPASYPPFSFVYNLLTRKSCRSIWDLLLKGHGIFPVCAPGSSVRTFQISGYLQLSGNRLTDVIPTEIGSMESFSMFHMGDNDFYGALPHQIGQVPLVLFNISANYFSGEIPTEIGNIRCLQNLDLSYNNFSGTFPTSLNNLADLNKFNVSYNPLITGAIPETGQLATFEKDSYYGDPLLHLPSFLSNSSDPSKPTPVRKSQTPGRITAFLILLALVMAILVCGILTRVALGRSPTNGYLLNVKKQQMDIASNSGGSSPWLSDSVKIIRLDKTAFTHGDILRATGNFSDDRIIGKGGFGTVYHGLLPDGREVAIKKLLREGVEGEREFQAEMKVLSGNGIGWPHPHLVTLHGWCLDGSDKILVYEFMEGGSLEDLISDCIRLSWSRRLQVAIDVTRALVFLHHECYPSIVHRDVKASNVLLDKYGRARVTDFGLARVVDAGDSHVSTVVAGTVGYVAPEYGQTWQATTKGDVYSFGVLAMELATGRRALDGGEECLVDWARRVVGHRRHGFSRASIPIALLGSGLAEGAQEMFELLKIGIKCVDETPHCRPSMKEVLDMLIRISSRVGSLSRTPSPPSL